jgi:hypothetical protein
MPRLRQLIIARKKQECAGLRGARMALAVVAAIVLGACAQSPPPPSAATAASDDVRLPALANASEFTSLGGLTSASVKHLFGEPDLRRQEATAQIWQYRSAECVLEIYLYRDDGQYRVAYAETHDRGLVRVSQSTCYTGLAAARDRARPSRF